MTLREVFSFEVAYQLRRPATWAFALILVSAPFIMTRALTDSPMDINAPLNVAAMCTVIGLVGMIVTAALVGDAATRDHETGTYPLFCTTPIRRPAYFGGRFLGALAVNATLLLAIPVGLLIAATLPYSEEVSRGPFRPIAYIQPLLLLTYPNLLLSAAILFGVATFARRTLPTYVAGIALLVGYIYAMNEQASLSQRARAALLDPFGIAPLQNVTRYWTTAEQNVRLIGFPEALLWNRLIWLAFAAVVLAFVYWRFRLTLPGDGRGRRRRERTAEVAAAPQAAIAVPSVNRRFAAGTAVRQAFAVAGHMLREILSSRVFHVIAVGALLISFAFGWDVGAIVFDTSTWHVTHLVATVLTAPAAVAVVVLIAIFAGELVWRERDAGVNEIAATAPVPDWVPPLGKFLALVGMLVVLQAVLMAAGILLQAVRGYYDFELGLYVKILFGMTLPEYVLYAALAMVVHVVVNNKPVGHIVVILAFLFTVLAGRFGVHHNLLIFAGDPGWIYSDMNGFGPFVSPFVWFTLYWAAWALLLAVAARLFIVRGTQDDWRERLRLARGRITTGAVHAAAIAVLLILTLGGFIFYNTNVLNDYRTPEEVAAARAEYERRYKKYEHTPQPRITRAALRIEIWPDRAAADLRGHYTLVNHNARPVDSVHVLLDREIRARSLQFDRAATRVLEDRELRYHVYALQRPLEPGDSLRLSFDLAFQSRGFRNQAQPTQVVKNGAYFDRRWLPVIGYQTAYELTDEDRRTDNGLPPRRRMRPTDDSVGTHQRFELQDADLVHIDAIVGTDGDQIAITPGSLLRSWRSDGRRYFHYRTEEPMSYSAPFLSGEYAVKEDRWNDVTLRIFYHPAHSFNVDRMMRSMKASLEYFTAHFGPYQFNQLRIVQFPRYASFARAHPHTIAFSEGSAFITRVDEGDVDRPFFVVAHETAHQWWGGQVSPARVKGAALLSETLAQYSAMMVMEKTYGREQVRRFYRYEMDRYLGGRAAYGRTEVPLLGVEEQSFLYYHKGAVVMYTLREFLGEERVNTALRRYLENHRAGVPPFPVVQDLYTELRAVTPDTLQYLLMDLFEHITLWNVRVDDATVERTTDGQYRVTLRVRGSKVRVDSTGTETEAPMNDLVEIGIFAGASTGRYDPGEPLYLRRHRIRSGDQTISVVVPSEPLRAGVDPYHKLIQRSLDDKVVPLSQKQ